MGLSDFPPPADPICQILSESRSVKSLRDAFLLFWSFMDRLGVNLEGVLASGIENGNSENLAPQTGMTLCNFG